MLADEESRSQSFTLRAGGITAGVGVIVPLSGLLAKPTAGVEPGVRIVVAALATAGVLLLLVGAAIAVWKVLLPGLDIAIAISEVKKYPTDAFVSQEPLQIKGRLLRGAAVSLEMDRLRNEEKAKWLRRSYAGVGWGLAVIAVVAVILTVAGQTGAQDCPMTNPLRPKTGLQTGSKSQSNQIRSSTCPSSNS